MVWARSTRRKNWTEVGKKVEKTCHLWSRRGLSLKGRAEVCASHIYPLIVYLLSILPLPDNIMSKLEAVMFEFLWQEKKHLVNRGICQLHPSEGGLGMPNLKTRQTILRFAFLERMCTEEDDGNGDFWKEDAKRAFPTLRSVRSDGILEAYKLPRDECSFYRECRLALRVFLRYNTRLSDTASLSLKALYRLIVRGAAKDEINEELGLTKSETRSLWPWVPGMKCLTNDEASLTWLTIRDRLWVGKRLIEAKMVATPECKRCGEMEETVEHAFFHCSAARPLCKLIEDYMVRIRHPRFFALEASAVCSNVMPPLEWTEHYVLFCLLGVMRVVIWTTRQKGFYGDESFTSGQLVGYLKHQLKVKIRAERERLTPSKFNERWVRVARLCRIKGAEIEWHL